MRRPRCDGGVVLNRYEMMFLFDPAFASDFQQAKGEVERILGRSGAQIVFLEKWDERRLAYEIQGRKRGCYVLSYFDCDPTKIVDIERDAGLSEPILRVLIKQAEGVTREQMEGFLPGRREEDTQARGDRPPRTESAGRPPAERKPLASPANSEKKPAAESADAVQEPAAAETGAATSAVAVDTDNPTDT